MASSKISIKKESEFSFVLKRVLTDGVDTWIFPSLFCLVILLIHYGLYVFDYQKEIESGRFTGNWLDHTFRFPVLTFFYLVFGMTVITIVGVVLGAIFLVIYMGLSTCFGQIFSSIEEARREYSQENKIM